MNIRFQKPLYKVLTDSNEVRFISAWGKGVVRKKCYDLYGSQNFIIKEVL